MPSIRPSLRPALILVTALALLTSTAGCKDRKAEKETENLIEKQARGPIVEGARTLSERADIVVAFRSFEALSNTLATLSPDKREEFEQSVPLFKDFKETAGLSMLSLDGWEQTGVTTDAPFYIVSYYGRHNLEEPVVAIPVSDRQKFELYMTRQFELEATGRGEGYTVYNDDLMMVDCGPLVLLADEEAGRELCATQGKIQSRSVAETTAFQDFERAVMSDGEVFGVYMPARGPVYGELFEELFGRYSKAPLVPTAMAKLVLSATGAGAGFKIKNKAWVARSWFGLDPTGVALAKELTRATPVMPLSSLVTKDVLAATAFRLDGVNMWELFVSMLTAEAEQELEEGLAELEEQMGVDLEPGRDIFAGHTGNILIAAYPDPVNDDILDVVFPIAMTSYSSDADITRIQGLIDKVNQRINAPLEKNTLTSGDGKTIEVWTIQGFVPISLCFGNKRIAIAHGALDPSIIQAAFFGVPKDLALPKEQAAKIDGEIGGILDGALFKKALVANGELEPYLAPMFPDNVLMSGKLTDLGFVLVGHADPVPNAETTAKYLEMLVQDSITDEAFETSRRLADGAKSYFTSEQKYGALDWHPANPSEPGKSAGYPTPWDEYVFPGGTDTKMTTVDAIPTGGERVAYAPKANIDLSQLLDKLNLTFEGETYWRVTYETGPGRGDKATATITAEHDFDPKKPGAHTITQKLYVDAYTQEIIVTPQVTTNEYH